jgi:hypothetical protein
MADKPRQLSQPQAEVSVSFPVRAQVDAKKVTAVIYLASNRPLRVLDFLDEFHRNWPSQTLEKTGREPHRALFRIGRSEFTLELHHSPVPQAITEPVANSTLHWPIAGAALARNVAYIELSTPTGSQSVLSLSCSLTRATASLLPVTDSLAVCWLNGPALNPSRTFIANAREMFATGLVPLTLWTAVRWDPQSRFLFTHGMNQFDAPEIVLSHQPDAAPLMVDYLFQLALSLVNSRHPVSQEETVESPHGRLKVKPGRSTQTGRTILILEPY